MAKKVKGTYSKNRSRGKSQYGPRNRKDKNTISDGVLEKDYTNDPSWYGANSQLLKDAASLSFSTLAGTKVNIGLRSGQSYGSSDIQYIAGALRLDLCPSIGMASEATDAATVSARNLYTFVRHANSGHTNYEAPDLFMYMIAYAHCVSFIEDMKRAYSGMFTYAARNRYFAADYVRLLGYEYSNFVTTISDFRSYINLCCARLNALKVPTGWPYFNRMIWVSNKTFLDDASMKSQLYVPRYKYFARFDATTESTGSSLQYQERPYFTDLSTLKTWFEPFLNALLSDEDCNIMSGDIMKAYGNNTYILDGIAENYFNPPSYDIVALTQFHNAFSMGPALYTTKIIQDTAGVISEVTTNPTSSFVGCVTEGVYLDVYDQNPTPELIMESTRLLPAYKVVDGTKMGISSCGADYAVSFEILAMPEGQITMNSILLLYNSGLIEISTNYLRALNCVSKFESFPTIYTWVQNPDETSNFWGCITDLQNYTVVSNDSLRKMNQVAMLSMLAHNII